MSLSYKKRTLSRLIEGVPACGLAFGATLTEAGHGVTVTSSSADAPACESVLRTILHELTADNALPSPSRLAASCAAIHAAEGSLLIDASLLAAAKSKVEPLQRVAAQQPLRSAMDAAEGADKTDKAEPPADKVEAQRRALTALQCAIESAEAAASGLIEPSLLTSAKARAVELRLRVALTAADEGDDGGSDDFAVGDAVMVRASHIPSDNEPQEVVGSSVLGEVCGVRSGGGGFLLSEGEAGGVPATPAATRALAATPTTPATRALRVRLLSVGLLTDWIEPSEVSRAARKHVLEEALTAAEKVNTVGSTSRDVEPMHLVCHNLVTTARAKLDEQRKATAEEALVSAEEGNDHEALQMAIEAARAAGVDSATIDECKARWDVEQARQKARLEALDALSAATTADELLAAFGLVKLAGDAMSGDQNVLQARRAHLGRLLTHSLDLDAAPSVLRQAIKHTEAALPVVAGASHELEHVLRRAKAEIGRLEVRQAAEMERLAEEEKRRLERLEAGAPAELPERPNEHYCPISYEVSALEHRCAPAPPYELLTSHTGTCLSGDA